ncbi:hypothetical protein HPB50_006649 [Hyalomma asiaticum]|uniref:Uncharacterized protein n=1 Tax=Hyalomma asiaticum TaxID=266040 RepID=A0ACB7SSX5_HYAAI|nr:hypothetical protein HPB50_006649 [Hyalomma asiaticum]
MAEAFCAKVRLVFCDGDNKDDNEEENSGGAARSLGPFTMGKLLSRLRRNEEPLDATGMTPREKKAVRDVWTAFCKEHPDYGVLLFHAFFLKYPDDIQLFKHFKGKNLRTLATDHEFRRVRSCECTAHCSLVGEEITSIIEALGNVTQVLEILEKNALLHQRIRGVTPAHFAKFSNVVVDVLTANHEDLMTSAAQDAWKKFFENTPFSTPYPFLPQFVVSFITVSFEKSKKNVMGSTASSYKVATMSTFYGPQPGGAAPSAAHDKAATSDAVGKDAGGRRSSSADAKSSGTASTDTRQRQSLTRKPGEILSSRKASLPTESHAAPIPDRLSHSEPCTSSAPSGRRRSSTKSLTHLPVKKLADLAGTSSASLSKRRASNASLGKASEHKPSDDHSAASEKSKASQQPSLGKRTSSKISHSSLSEKDKPK